MTRVSFSHRSNQICALQAGIETFSPLQLCIIHINQRWSQWILKIVCLHRLKWLSECNQSLLFIFILHKWIHCTDVTSLFFSGDECVKNGRGVLGRDRSESHSRLNVEWNRFETHPWGHIIRKVNHMLGLTWLEREKLAKQGTVR